jgi:hypothetical protein
MTEVERGLDIIEANISDLYDSINNLQKIQEDRFTTIEGGHVVTRGSLKDIAVALEKFEAKYDENVKEAKEKGELSLNNSLRFFTDFAVKKRPHAGQFEPVGMVAVRCLDDGSAEHSLPRPTERQLRLRRSHRPERLFPDGA